MTREEVMELKNKDYIIRWYLNELMDANGHKVAENKFDYESLELLGDKKQAFMDRTEEFRKWYEKQCIQMGAAIFVLVFAFLITLLLTFSENWLYQIAEHDGSLTILLNVIAIILIVAMLVPIWILIKKYKLTYKEKDSIQKMFAFYDKEVNDTVFLYGDYLVALAKGDSYYSDYDVLVQNVSKKKKASVIQGDLRIKTETSRKCELKIRSISLFSTHKYYLFLGGWSDMEEVKKRKENNLELVVRLDQLDPPFPNGEEYPRLTGW